MRRQIVLGAAEVGEYVFCRRAWWLRHVHGMVPANQTDLLEGTHLHDRHGKRARTAAWLQFGGYILALLAMILAGFWLFPHLL
ncbi:MAG: hypothetical protein QF660_01560 [Anaerolineales bacterium]|jgi:uncharacterized membrane protein|nr:hypothetical protein [Anaerolineales bacterium]